MNRQIYFGAKLPESHFHLVIGSAGRSLLGAHAGDDQPAVVERDGKVRLLDTGQLHEGYEHIFGFVNVCGGNPYPAMADRARRRGAVEENFDDPSLIKLAGWARSLSRH